MHIPQSFAGVPHSFAKMNFAEAGDKHAHSVQKSRVKMVLQLQQKLFTTLKSLLKLLPSSIQSFTFLYIYKISRLVLSCNADFFLCAVYARNLETL